jgi:cytochrome c1
MAKSLNALCVLACCVMLISTGCAPKTAPSEGGAPTAPPTARKAGAPPTLSGVALGKQIFTTGNGASGKHVAFKGGSSKFKAKPGGCIFCHGPDAKGKPFGKPKTPNITYAALREPQGGKPANYPTDEIVRGAITTGKDEKGQALDPAMPRWQLSDTEFQGVVEYLKSLSKAPAAAARPAKSPAAAAPTKPSAY